MTVMSFTFFFTIVLIYFSIWGHTVQIMHDIIEEGATVAAAINAVLAEVLRAVTLSTSRWCCCHMPSLAM